MSEKLTLTVSPTSEYARCDGVMIPMYKTLKYRNDHGESVAEILEDVVRRACHRKFLDRDYLRVVSWSTRHDTNRYGNQTTTYLVVFEVA